MKVIFNCAGWINFRKVITPYIFLLVSFTNWCFIININIIPYTFPALLITYQNIIQNPFLMLFETCFDQKVPWNFLQSSMELFEHHLNNTRGSMEFHGTWATKSQVPWNSMEFHGILSRSKVPWNSIELFPYSRVSWNSIEFHGTFNFPQKSSMEFHWIPWNFFLKFHGIPWNSMEPDKFHIKKILFQNIVFGIWLMIRCYLAKISQKRYIWHWFQYRNSYFEQPSVSENGVLLYTYYTTDSIHAKHT